MPIVEVYNLFFTYPDGREVLHDIHFAIEEGEKVAFIGANGAGKSTLLYHLNGVLTGTGSVIIGSLPLNPENLRQARSMVGMVFQNPDDQLFSSTVQDDVAYGPIYQGLPPDLVAGRVSDALEAVQMQNFAHRNPYHLSGGEKKRISLATVLSMKPCILAFDEPSAGLDPRARRELIELLSGLPQTLILASHDLDMVQQIAHRVFVLKDGRITAEGPTDVILNDQSLLFENGLI